ncbi:hypothetical protein [Nonomuraea aridisoli]|nr:hypothetical protein [Nonomuraea aridisoli]
MHSVVDWLAFAVWEDGRLRMGPPRVFRLGDDGTFHEISLDDAFTK